MLLALILLATLCLSLWISARAVFKVDFKPTSWDARRHLCEYRWPRAGEALAAERIAAERRAIVAAALAGD